MTPMPLILTMPNGEERETSFTEAEKMICGHFPRREQPPAVESDLGNDGESERVPLFPSFGKMN